MANLRTYIVEDSPVIRENLVATLEELEETAKLWLMSTPRPQPLSADQIEQLRQTFGAIWPTH